ncbi:MAG: hypothetical protein QOJ64_1311 [Acidobacteriota bacterium]|jgi:hypothetical protein|nr:hypothetical protein [Acidobacteriota bacterium]
MVRELKAVLGSMDRSGLIGQSRSYESLALPDWLFGWRSSGKWTFVGKFCRPLKRGVNLVSPLCGTEPSLTVGLLPRRRR